MTAYGKLLVLLLIGASGLAQVQPCSLLQASNLYFRRLDPVFSSVSLPSSGVVNLADCLLYINEKPYPVEPDQPSAARVRMDQTALLPDGFAYASMRSKSTGISGRQSIYTIGSMGISSFGWSAREGLLYAVQRPQSGPAALVKIDPSTREVVARSAPLPVPSQLALSDSGRQAWVTTGDGASVTPIALPDLLVMPAIPLPEGFLARRLWAHPADDRCFVADVGPAGRTRNPGAITVYCGGRPLPRTLPAEDEIQDVLFEKSGESWTYSTRVGRLFRLSLDSDGLQLQGVGVPVPAQSGRLIGGFGRLYFGGSVIKKSDLSVTTLQSSTFTLGVDEQAGIIYSGNTFRGVFVIGPETTILRVSRDPDLRDLRQIFDSNLPQPYLFLPTADLLSFIGYGGGRYAFLSLTQNQPGTETLYSFALKGLDKKLLTASQGIVHAASQQPGAIAPGMIVSIYGSGIGPMEPVAVPPPSQGDFAPVSWNQSSVLFNGQPATILFASENQINVVVPEAVRFASSAQMRVFYGAFASEQASVPVVRKRPAFFTSNAIGGAAVAVFPDGAIAGLGRNPRPGDIVSLFGAGFGGPGEFGLTEGAMVTTPRELARGSVQISICGKPAEVLYAGLAPGFRFGLFQFNVRIPQCESTTGGRTPLSVSADGFAGPEGVSLPIE